MLNLKYKIAATATTAAIIATSFAPALSLAATNVTVSGNGADSVNEVKVKNKYKARLTQRNRATVDNTVVVGQDTGGNKANDNTGGDTEVSSGKATANVTNTTITNGNSATIEECGCVGGNTKVDVSGNGSDSDNTVKVRNKNVVRATQRNVANVTNVVVVGQTTGDNSANDNTGGSVEVNSGDTSTTVNNSTTTGSNSLTL